MKTKMNDSKLTESCRCQTVPVEVVPFGWEWTRRQLENLGCSVCLRTDRDRQPFITENHNRILDCRWEDEREPTSLHHQMLAIPGVVETGLFLSMVDSVWVSDGTQVDVIRREKK